MVWVYVVEVVSGQADDGDGAAGQLGPCGQAGGGDAGVFGSGEEEQGAVEGRCWLVLVGLDEFEVGAEGGEEDGA